MYESTADKRFQNPKNKADYFPLTARVKSRMYSNLDNLHDKFINIMEVMYGIDQIQFDDSLFQLVEITDREKSFINANSIRMVRDKKGTYVD